MLLAIKTSDFYQRIKTNEETWSHILKSSTLKENNIYQSIHKNEILVKENLKV